MRVLKKNNLKFWKSNIHVQIVSNTIHNFVITQHQLLYINLCSWLHGGEDPIVFLV